tara:strand:+ start:38282 stop:38485 length:204 start_codon:yes stop_codon:yes gene_type:complete
MGQRGRTDITTAGLETALHFDAHKAFVVAMIDASKDVTLDEMVERLSAERQVSISRSALGAWLRGRG